MIHCTALEKRYPAQARDVEALRGIDLNIQRGEYLAIMGPSGSGKSTLMNILGCLDTPTAGSYYLNGENVSRFYDQRLSEIRNREIGFVFQTFNLLPNYTALENVMVPLIYAGYDKNTRRTMAYEALQEVHLTARASHKPAALSGGQRQRVALARALVNRPSLILADEPTGNLDTKTAAGIMQLFAAVHQAGNTIIVVTHEKDIAARTNRTINLIDGQIAADRVKYHA
jgi:putative ABC transport system ATP-binding protein